MAGDIVALVVNWSTPDDLLDCIMSAEKHEKDLRWVLWQHPHPHISSSQVIAALDDMLGDRIRIHHGEENLGHGWGINRAADSAKVWNPEYFFIVNPDVVWKQPVLDRMVRFLEEDPVRCIVGPKQMDSKHRITAAGIVGCNKTPKHRDWHRPDPKNVLHRDRVESVMVAGSAMVIRTKDFFEYGGLLESAHYYSETWLCYHVRQHSREVWYWGEPWMIHEWHQSSPIGYAETDGRMKDDRALFRKMCDQHDPPIERD